MINGSNIQLLAISVIMADNTKEELMFFVYKVFKTEMKFDLLKWRCNKSVLVNVLSWHTKPW